LEFFTGNEQETYEIGRRLGEAIGAGTHIALDGDLGAGKTVFTRGLAGSFGIKSGVKSPTFTLVREYHGEEDIAHFDLYRLEDEEELFETGFYEYLDSDCIVIAEWAVKFPGVMGEDAITVNIERVGEDARRITVLGTEKWGIETI